ncbi:Hypothetical predicted protein, partial [Mytilus galloprovincialis]
SGVISGAPEGLIRFLTELAFIFFQNIVVNIMEFYTTFIQPLCVTIIWESVTSNRFVDILTMRTHNPIFPFHNICPHPSQYHTNVKRYRKMWCQFPTLQFIREPTIQNFYQVLNYHVPRELLDNNALNNGINYFWSTFDMLFGESKWSAMFNIVSVNLGLCFRSVRYNRNTSDITLSVGLKYKACLR